MTNEEWTEVVAWVEARYPKAWAAEQNVAYFEDLGSFDASDVWTGILGFYETGSAFPPTGSQLVSRARVSRKAAAVEDRYDRVALPEPDPEPTQSKDGYLADKYPDEQVSWTEHIRRVHADGYPCQSRLCDIHNEELLAKQKENA